VLGLACGAPDGGAAGVQQEIVGVVEEFFAAMRTRDTGRLRQLAAPHLVLVAARDSSGVIRVTRFSLDEFLAAVARTPEEIRERIWTPEVRVDGPIATLWAPYDFHLGERLSHCGTDAFHLVREASGWQVTAVLYSAVPPPCDGPPAWAR
jgi:RNase P/RNase MRP subunit POP5